MTLEEIKRNAPDGATHYRSPSQCKAKRSIANLLEMIGWFGTQTDGYLLVQKN